MYRIGQGIDFHQFTENRKLILGGIEIPYHLGLSGHSDADVLLHSIMDSLLGAASLGDIGQHFSDQDPAFKDIDSCILLTKTKKLIERNHFIINNIDNTIIAQKPKFFPYITQMKQKISQILGIELNQISIKATTTEKMGFIGRGEGIAALSNCLLQQIQER